MIRERDKKRNNKRASFEMQNSEGKDVCGNTVDNKRNREDSVAQLVDKACIELLQQQRRIEERRERNRKLEEGEHQYQEELYYAEWDNIENHRQERRSKY